MDTTAAFDTDPMLNLLTEALRRGPGSPEWHRAVGSLRDINAPQADDYQLLMTARERLESGRAYREVRPGPAFTKQLFGALDAEPAAPKRITLRRLIQLLCLLMLLVAAGTIAALMIKSQSGVDPLAGRLFVTPVRAWTYNAMPDELRVVGSLPLEVRGGGLRPAGRAADGADAGTLFSDLPLDLTRGTCVEMRIDYKPGPTATTLTLMHDPLRPGGTLNMDEVAITCDATGVQFRSAVGASAPRALPTGSHLLRIKVIGDTVVAEVDGRVIWSGRQSLGGRAYVGVRFEAKPRANDAAVRSLRVLSP